MVAELQKAAQGTATDAEAVSYNGQRRHDKQPVPEIGTIGYTFVENGKQMYMALLGFEYEEKSGRLRVRCYHPVNGPETYSEGEGRLPRCKPVKLAIQEPIAKAKK